jgi:hypothetical protein
MELRKRDCVTTWTEIKTSNHQIYSGPATSVLLPLIDSNHSLDNLHSILR